MSETSALTGVGKRHSAWRPLWFPIGVLVLGLSASIGSFLVESGAVQHTDRVLLRQYAVQGSLILSSFVGQPPPDVSQLASHLPLAKSNPTGWSEVAEPVASHNHFSALALVRATGDSFSLVATTGALHGRFGTSADSPVLASLRHGTSIYSSAVGDAGARWLAQWVASTTAPGYYVYSEELLSDTLISLGSLPGHPFAGIDGAVYVGQETPQDLVFASTAHLPLTGQRAVTTISNGTPFSTNPARLSTHVGTLSDPGGFILVVHPTGNLSGSPSAVLPWVLLIAGLGATFIVAFLLWVSENRRAKLGVTVAELEESNVHLDNAVSLQKSATARFSAMVRSSTDLTTVISSDGRISYQSPSSSALLGRRPDDLLVTSFRDLIHPDDESLWLGALAHADANRGTEVTQELHLGARDGSYVAVETRITNLLDDPAVSGIVLNSRDITEHKRLESELRHQAFHDSLTGLANRALFEDRLENALSRLSRTKGNLGVLFLDLDDFKAVNDGRGHDVGDELLRAVSQRLRTVVRAGDTLARLGGDEFAILVEGTDPAASRDTADRIMQSFHAPVSIRTGEAAVRVSIGVVTTSNAEHSARELLRDADVAMYSAKNAGKGRIEVFHAGLHDEVIRRLQLELDLGRAVENDELRVHYQPLVDLNTTEMVGVEALMRWVHPDRGVVMPGDFIPAAESTGLIVGMGKWMLHTACRDVRVLQQRTGRSDLHLAVNLSIKQLDHPGIVDDVKSALDESELQPHLLTLEITESVFMTGVSRSRAALELKALGVRLSIDDFGTGFSSLGYLNRLPVDELKIDRSFIAATESGDKDTRSLVRTIIRLAQDFGLGTVAEGIETPQQLEVVRRAGCQLAQGYFFARPVDLAELLHQAVNSRNFLTAGSV